MTLFNEGNESHQPIHIADSLEQLAIRPTRTQMELIGAPNDAVWESSYRIAGGNTKKAIETYSVLRGAIKDLAAADTGESTAKLRNEASDIVQATNNLIDRINS